jgi:predicted DNA binding CopG/RHH family protein
LETLGLKKWLILELSYDIIVATKEVPQLQKRGDFVADINEIIEFQNTNFTKEPKEEWIKFRVTKKQKKAIKTMAKTRKMKMSELVMSLLQYEKETNVILNKVLEEDFKEGEK